MGERTEHRAGTHSWADLATSDLEGAKRFYSGLLGWEFQDMPAGDDQIYSMAALGGKTVAAAYTETEGPMPPHWNCYVTVESADDMAGKVEEAGGEVVMPPFDVLDVGRMLVVRDPSGAFLSLWEARGHIGAQLVNAPGALCWNDLASSDPQAAMDFYGRLLGWTFDGSEYAGEYWTIKNGERDNGGVRTFSDEERDAGVMSHWLPYFAVESLDGALRYVGDNGGTVAFGPTDIGGTNRTAAIQDPQGAVLMLYEGRLDD